LLIGAGIGGQTVVREIRRPGSEYTPLGYVDDDHSKLRLRIEGVPVIGVVKDLPELVKSYPVDEVLIAVPSATSQQMQHFVRACQKASVKFRTVPALRDVIAQRVSISDFRQVDVNDLLGREPVRIDLESVRMAIMGRVIVVTGAAGSIGSELCRQILEYRPRVLICIDHNETGLFYLQHELAHLKSKAILRFYVADVGDQRRMEAIFCTDHPDTIFHAAAYKHVPMMETNVQEAVQNNVFALLRLLEAASEKGCDTFILISSDKAVCPSSVMGATKRICELIINHRPTETMRCLSVRFGNVLGSNGSVVPVLQEQLRKGQPLTITHPDMKRFFMTIREAVSLVLQASLVGEHGETLVLDMGEPLSILEVAQTLIRLSGKSVQDVPIVFTGVRPGERLTERLFYDDEEVCPTSFPKIKRVRCATRDWTALSRRIEELEEILFLIGAESVRAKIREMVPEYSDEVQLSAVG
jgi:FlaA1/EpsC-like NDP-sugar epimerase